MRRQEKRREEKRREEKRREEREEMRKGEERRGEDAGLISNLYSKVKVIEYVSSFSIIVCRAIMLGTQFSLEFYFVFILIIFVFSFH